MSPHILRRDVLASGLVALPALALNSFASEADVRRETHTYKKVGGLKIQADVFRFTDSKIRPALVWIHGGALINGGRQGISRRVAKFALDSGYVLISIDYRLAPETKLAEILSDVEAAFQWIHKTGRESFNVDTKRVGVAGGSAGGYLTLTSGFRATPRPSVLLSLWGYGDLVGPWYSKPSPHRRHNLSKVSREEAFKQVSGPPIANSKNRKGNGGKFYAYCRQTGTWPEHVSGWNPHQQAAKFDPYMPVKNVTAEYPPTAMIHGVKDTDVPHEQSAMMAEQLQKHGVPFQLHSIENGEHGLPGGDPKAIEAAYKAAFEFVSQRLQGD